MKKACIFLYGASAALMIISTIFQLQHHLYAKLGYLAMALGVQLIGPLAVKGLKLKNAWGLLFWTQLFIAVAMIIGNTLNGYAIPCFDKVLHFSSGILICAGITLVYCWLKQQWTEDSRRHYLLKCLSIQGINLMIAFLWECFEFACLIFLKIDAINHYTQGVYDTMTDMIVCFLGGLVFLTLLTRHERKGKNDPLTASLKTFYQTNLKDR